MAQNVTKCICHDRSFAEIKEYAEDHDLDSLEELQSRKYCCCSCGLCAPYVELMLETGETVFARGAFYKRKQNGNN